MNEPNCEHEWRYIGDGVYQCTRCPDVKYGPVVPGGPTSVMEECESAAPKGKA